MAMLAMALADILWVKDQLRGHEHSGQRDHQPVLFHVLFVPGHERARGAAAEPTSSRHPRFSTTSWFAAEPSALSDIAAPRVLSAGASLLIESPLLISQSSLATASLIATRRWRRSAGRPHRESHAPFRLALTEFYDARATSAPSRHEHGSFATPAVVRSTARRSPRRVDSQRLTSVRPRCAATARSLWPSAGARRTPSRSLNIPHHAGQWRNAFLQKVIASLATRSIVHHARSSSRLRRIRLHDRSA